MAEEKKGSKIEITKVVVQEANAYKLPTGEVVNFEEYIVWLGNQILQIKRGVA